MNKDELIERMKEKHGIDEQLSKETLAKIREARQQESEGDIQELIEDCL